jgi:hypothetical protein
MVVLILILLFKAYGLKQHMRRERKGAAKPRCEKNKNTPRPFLGTYLAT